jgi:DNA-binding response OmpR family regulator
MKVLLLEDDPTRIKQFKQRFLERGWAYTVTSTADDCIAEFRKGGYNLLFLDHDLGGEQMVDCAHKNTGSEVARQIGRECEAPVVIHSFNAAGAEYMRHFFENVLYLPGVWVEFTFRRYFL